MAFANSLAAKLGVLPDIHSSDLYLQHLLLDGAFTPARFRLTGSNNQAALAKEAIEETHVYRNKLLKSKDRIPPLITLCLFKLNKHVHQPLDKRLTISSSLTSGNSQC